MGSELELELKSWSRHFFHGSGQKGRLRRSGYTTLGTALKDFDLCFFSPFSEYHCFEYGCKIVAIFGKSRGASLFSLKTKVLDEGIKVGNVSPELSYTWSTIFHLSVASSCTACWCSSSPGRRMVRMSRSNSAASHSSSTYSLCTRCSLRLA